MLNVLFGAIIAVIGLTPSLFGSARVAHRQDGTTMQPAEHIIRKFLPLSALDYSITLSLSDGEKHGYVILKDMIDRSEGLINIGPATLYRALLRLTKDHLLEELPEQGSGDDRRRYFALTPLGQAVLHAEALRLSREVRDAVRRQVIDSDDLPSF